MQLYALTLSSGGVALSQYAEQELPCYIYMVSVAKVHVAIAPIA